MAAGVQHEVRQAVVHVGVSSAKQVVVEKVVWPTKQIVVEALVSVVEHAVA